MLDPPPSPGRVVHAAARRLKFRSARPNAVQAGLGRTFQNIRLFQNMNPLENIRGACTPPVAHARRWATRPGTAGICSGGGGDRGGRAELLRMFRPARSGRRARAQPSVWIQRRLESPEPSPRVPRCSCSIEPTAGMNPQESLELMDLIRRVDPGALPPHRAAGRAQHESGDGDERADHGDRYGETIALGTPEADPDDPRVIEAYLGAAGARSRPMLELRDADQRSHTARSALRGVARGSRRARW